MKIIDCFMFYNEFELLQMRLDYLWPVVDKFVIVEGAKTFTGQNKPLRLLERVDILDRYGDKLIYIAVDDYPPYDGDPWKYEKFQRNAIERGLADCSSTDIILVSDVDEIPDRNSIQAKAGQVCIYGMRIFYYYMNLEATPDAVELRLIKKRTGCNSPWYGTRSVMYADYTSAQQLRDVKAKKIPEIKRIFSSKVKRKIICDAGWHFSYLLTDLDIVDKINAFSHTEFTDYGLNEENVIRKLRSEMKPVDPGRSAWKLERISMQGLPSQFDSDAIREKGLVL